MNMFFTVVINCALIGIAVMIHYEILLYVSRLLNKVDIAHRLRVILGLFGTLFAHVLEVWVFAFGYYFMIKSGQFGTMDGNFTFGIQDCVYFSFSTYTSLGLGDIAPVGNLRFLAGLETLTGLVLISWTASFMFIEMQKFWETGKEKI